MGSYTIIAMTIDANIIIAYLAGEQKVIQALSQWRYEGKSLFLSTVAETEVLSFSQWSDEERANTELFLAENFFSVPFDRPLAHIASHVRRTGKVKFPDAAIAATALSTHTPLITRNLRDFKKIPHLEIIGI